jgi:hypothetical protein
MHGMRPGCKTLDLVWSFVLNLFLEVIRRTEMELFLDDSISCISGFRNYRAAALDRGNRYE